MKALQDAEAGADRLASDGKHFSWEAEAVW